MTGKFTPYPPFDEPWDADEEVGVRAAVDDYFGGWFEASPDRMRRALHPALVKRGLLDGHPEPDEEFPSEWQIDTFEKMVKWTAEGAGQQIAPEDRHWATRVIEIRGNAATAIAHSVPYIEYLHLIRTPDGWRIIASLWQAP